MKSPSTLMAVFRRKLIKLGLGAVIFFKQGKKKFRIRANEQFDELETNNEAEYAAFYLLLLLEELGVHHLSCEFKGDSQVVLKQLEGSGLVMKKYLIAGLTELKRKLKALGLYLNILRYLEMIIKKQINWRVKHLEGKEIFAKTQLL